MSHKSGRTATPIVYNDVTYATAKSACEAAGVNYGTLMTYVTQERKSAQEIFNRMLQGRRCAPARTSVYTDSKLELPEGFDNLRQACKALGLEYTSMYNRIRKGMSFLDAANDIKNVVRRQPRRSKVELGFPVTVNDNVCRTIKEVADILEVSNTWLSNYIKDENCTIGEAIEHYLNVGVHMNGRSSDQLATCHIAYTGTDNKRYYYAICAICGTTLLVAEEKAKTFVHGEECSRLTISNAFIPSRVLARMRCNIQQK